MHVRGCCLLRIAALWAGVCLTGWFHANPCRAQTRSAPHDGYWPAFEPFLEGDFRTAAELFREAAKDGIVNANPNVPGPWIDAICYRAMLGECLYQMGQLGPALDEFNAALHLLLAHRDWMLRIEFPQGIELEAGVKTPRRGRVAT